LRRFIEEIFDISLKVASVCLSYDASNGGIGTVLTTMAELNGRTIHRSIDIF